ncbi:hypothetical protein CHU98_g430 [Xylaria longipes]|nr:hypothetical protein CHU98_g430 [Xylaria longipes]
MEPVRGESAAITEYTFQLPVDTSRPVSPACFETCAKDYESGRLSYEEFLDAALSHLDSESPSRHPEDCDLANLAKLSTCGPMGPVAAAIKLCMLRDNSQRTFSQAAIDILRRMEPSAASTELHSAATLSDLSDLPPLQLQIVLVAALQRELPTLAKEILGSSPPPEPLKESLFNLLHSALCLVGVGSQELFRQFPLDFWTAAVKTRWVAPSPSLARLASEIGPPGAPLLHALLDTGLHLGLIMDHLPLYRVLLWDVTEKHDDPSLLRDILVRVPHKKLEPDLLRVVVYQREHGGVEMLSMLLDCGLDINYRDKKRVSLAAQYDAWSGDFWWYQVSLTALHKAAEKGNRDAVSFLISRGANVNEPEYFGKTPRDLALEAGHHEIVQLFDEVVKL